jgi:site-specific DNA-methyltransferase (adenine-specific)
VKPIDLMRWLVRLVTPPGGMVLEPFAGSGTTPAACALEDVDCLAMELDADYVEIARARVAHAVQQREEELAAKIESSRQMDLFAMEACS